MKTLVQENENGKYGPIDPKYQEDYNYILNYEANEAKSLSTELAGTIKKLWQTDSIKNTYEHRNEFFFANGQVKHFFNDIENLVKSDYLPTELDVLRCRLISIGIRKEAFQINGVNCELVDVGGQKSERKKWKNLFENVYIVLFVVAISEYD